jgi:hypothetical protein
LGGGWGVSGAREAGDDRAALTGQAILSKLLIEDAGALRLVSQDRFRWRSIPFSRGAAAGLR